MTAEELKKLPKELVLAYIRERLSFSPEIQNQFKQEIDWHIEHRRFEMSGYDYPGKPGSCTLHNLSIVNEFAHLGIYDYTSYLFLDFYKGTPTLYLQKWTGDSPGIAKDLSGYSTSEIIYEIFEWTIFSGNHRRRREN